MINLDPQQSCQDKDTCRPEHINSDPALPHIPGGLEDFFESQVLCCSYKAIRISCLPSPTTTRPGWLALPFGHLAQQTDKKAFMAILATTDAQRHMTWTYYEVAKYITEQAAAGTQPRQVRCGQRPSSTTTDVEFSNVPAATRGLLREHRVGLDRAAPRKPRVDSEASIKAATFNKNSTRSRIPLPRRGLVGEAEGTPRRLAMIIEWHSSPLTSRTPPSPSGRQDRVTSRPRATCATPALLRHRIGISAYAPRRSNKGRWLFLFGRPRRRPFLCLNQTRPAAPRRP